MWIAIENINAYSGVIDGKLAIFPHIRDLIKGPRFQMPLLLKAVFMRHASVTLYNGLHHTFYWSGEMRRIGKQFRAQFYVNDGVIKTDNVVVLRNIRGTIDLETREHYDTVIPTICVEGQAEAPQLGAYPLCFITGRWFDDRGRFQIQSIDQSLRINPLIISEKNSRFYLDASIAAPAAYLTQFICSFDPKIQGYRVDAGTW